MRPQSEAFLEKSRDCLVRAETMLRVELHEDAGRSAYLAGFHAAQAFLFETTGKVFKSHKGVHSEFGRLTNDDPRFDLPTRAFLGRAYDLKAIADYETGPDAHISADQAVDAITAARSFLTIIVGSLGEERDPAAPAAEYVADELRAAKKEHGVGPEPLGGGPKRGGGRDIL